MTHDDYIKRRDEILSDDRVNYLKWLNGEGGWDPDTAQQAIDELVLAVIGEDALLLLEQLAEEAYEDEEASELAAATTHKMIRHVVKGGE
jgi:hypothetical protein